MRWAGAGDFFRLFCFLLHSREYEENRPLRAPDALAGRGSWLLGHCIFASAQELFGRKSFTTARRYIGTSEPIGLLSH